MIESRISQLRVLMKERGMDAYLVPTADFHESEYVGQYFKCREFLTGFTGSAGTAVVTADDCALWVDGRYFIQAEKELDGSPVRMMKLGEPGVPSVEDYLSEAIPKNGCLGFDGRVVNASLGKRLKEKLGKKNIGLAWGEDLIGCLWHERPALSAQPVWILEEKYAGLTARSKIEKVRTAMAQKGAGVHLLTTLDDLAWLLNIRGNDTENNPVVLSYGAITQEDFFFFVNPKVLSPDVAAYLAALKVTVRPYEDIYAYGKALNGEAVLLEESFVNYALYSSLGEDNRIITDVNPTAKLKTIKNAVEIENMRKAHLKDGAVIVRFIKWIKEHVGKVPMDELTAAAKLDELRCQTEGCLGLSFHTISAYKENAAMAHYQATPEHKKEIKAEGFYLVDSGGQYLEGTTDITRTIALGPLTAEEKEHYTLVLIGMLRLANARFPYGARGVNIDYAARMELWQRGLDFNHGTGHGVGYLLNVHERPVNIRWKIDGSLTQNAVLEPGMIPSDEPGIYIEGSHGIRTENLLLCVEKETTAFGRFLGFEHLTMAPIDLDAVELSLMNAQDKELLNRYHEQVYENLAPLLNEEERQWLKQAVRSV